MASQSRLTDMLAVLMCTEDEFDCTTFVNRNRLMLAGPILCMMSVAGTCGFKINLRPGFVEALCLLNVSVPYHKTNNGASNGRFVLAHADVSVRFLPGGRVLSSTTSLWCSTQCDQ